MASIPGHIKNEVVILGCHRDGERHTLPWIGHTDAQNCSQHGLWVLPILLAELSPYTKSFAALVSCLERVGNLCEQVGCTIPEGLSCTDTSSQLSLLAGMLKRCAEAWVESSGKYPDS
jgi:hypothetical protein